MGWTLVRAASVSKYASMFGMDFPFPAMRARILLCGLPLWTLGAFFDCFLSLYHSNHCMNGSPQHSSATELLCLLTQPMPAEDDWTKGYYNDPDTRIIIERLADENKKGQRWTKKELETVDPAFCQPLRDELIIFVRNRLCYIQPTQTERHAISLIVTPSSMRRKLFDAYHATPIAGHMGVYKTLHWLRLRFFWPKMRQCVVTWVAECAHCVLENSTRRVSSKLLFSFTPDEPFAIIHVDLWLPGDTLLFHEVKCQMVAMDDVTGSVLVVDVDDANAANLARLFFKHVLLVVGICCMVVVDDDNKFRDLFESMCNALGLKFHVLAKRNHKAMCVERFNRFLNKVITIKANNRDSNRIFPEAAHVAAYAWNLAPIDGTDIVRSYPAFGRMFRFPMDVELGVVPAPTTDNAALVTRFLEGVSEGRTVATHVLQIFREERATAYRKRINESRTQRRFRVGDMVTARVEVQSKSSDRKVAKLLYKSKGTMVIVADLNKGTYSLRHVDRPNGAPRKHKAEDMFLFPKALHPCEPFDSMDFRYLNFDRAPQPHPLRANLQLSVSRTGRSRKCRCVKGPPFSCVALLPDDRRVEPPRCLVAFSSVRSAGVAARRHQHRAS